MDGSMGLAFLGGIFFLAIAYTVYKAVSKNKGTGSGGGTKSGTKLK